MFQNIILKRVVPTSKLLLYKCVQHGGIVICIHFHVDLYSKSQHIFTKLIFIDHVHITNIITANTIQSIQQYYVFISMSNNAKLLSTLWGRPNVVFRGRQRFTVNEYILIYYYDRILYE